MMRRRHWSKVLPFGAALLWLALAAAPGAAASPDFAAWLDDLRREALAAGISEATLEHALAGVEPIERVIELDRRQPEFTQTFWAYLDNRVTEARIERARRLMVEHAAILDRVSARYGVQSRFLVAFWGLESNFGDFTGGFPVVGALATLAHDARRPGFFRAQLLDALRIIEQGDVSPERMQGSWAGAMGQVQFIPSTFVNHAVDFDGDRRRDIWASLPDIFASAANFLSRLGWRGDQTWGREVRLPAGFDWDLASLAMRKPIAEWQRLGVRRADGGDLPRAELAGAIALPAGHTGPAFLVYGNFDAILGWNRSLLYAIAVGHLADRIAGAGPLRAQRPEAERPLSRGELQEIQTLLASLGFDPGEADGIVGAKTRDALRAYQRRSRLAADGYPTPELLEDLRRLAGRQPSGR